MANNNSNLIEKLLGGSGLNQVWVKVFSLVKILTGDVDVKNKGNLQKQIDDVRSSVENMGKNQARVFQTVDELDTWLEEPSNVAQLTAGDNFYIVATDVPDYWWDGTQKQPLEGQKVDLSTYDQEINKLNEDIGNLQDQMASFESTKSEIVSSGLGQAIGLTASSIWSQIVEKIKAVVNRGAINQTLNAGGSYTIPQGYHNGSGKVTANSLASQTSANAGAAQILSGFTAWIKGNKVTGSMPNRGALNWSGSNTTYGVPAGYYSGGTLDSRPSYNAGVTAADNRSNPNSANYKAGYNAGMNAGKNTMASTLSCIYGYANNADSTKTYTASSAGYYLAIACAAGTGNANQNRSASISTNGSSKSYIRRWVADSVGASQGKCQHCVAVMLVYLNPGNTVTMTWESDYNKSGHAIVYKLG